jgi:putative tryptophan/tyrosine transport system substrate-binding protein
MKRRAFITLLGGAAAWPLAARAQQADQTRRIGVLTVFSKDDPEGQRRVSALHQRLQELGWVDGRNLRIELRWAGGDPDRARFYAGELVGMKPDVIFINHALVLPLLRQETHTVPIVFVQIADPVADGLVVSLAQPGGNMTGFTTGEYAMGGKKLEVLKEVARDLTRVTVIVDPRQSTQVGVAHAIEVAAPNFRPSGSCTQFSCILYGLGAALGSAPCAQSRSPAIPDSALAAAAIITVARNAWLIVVLP